MTRISVSALPDPIAVPANENRRISRYRMAERALWEHYRLQPTERFFNLGKAGTRIRVVEVGSGPPVLFAHGTVGSAPAFAPLISQLPDFRCLLFDRPGFALSSPVSYETASFGGTIADLQRQLLDALGIPMVDVVGHSIGGLFALRLARNYPARVRRIVLLGGGPMIDAAGVPPIIRLVASPLGGIMVKLMATRIVTRGMIRANGHGGSLADGRIPQAWVDWRTSVTRDTNSMRHERAMVQALVEGDAYRPGVTLVESELRAIAHPTLMLYGMADPSGSQVVWRRLIDAMPNAQLQVIEGAGHMVWLDQPGRVATETASFLRAD
jgi:pimeloyl-ACP methyl ester carboxylesterase